MIHQKELNKISLEIEPSLLYENKEEVVTKLLNDLYVGKCFRNAFIKNISSFELLSKVRFPVYRSSGSGIIDINFTADVIEFAPGDIIVGCVINKFSSEIIILKKDNINVFIKSSPIIEKLKLKRLLNVMVVDARFDNFSTNITISAIPFFFPTETPKQYLIKPDFVEMDHIVKLLEELKSLTVVLNKLENVEFYRNTCYPFKKYKKVDYYLVDIFDIENIDNKYFYRPNELYLDDNRIAISDTPFDDVEIVEDNWFMVMRVLILERIKYMNMLIEMVNTYNIEENKQLWSLYDYFKKD